MTILIIEDEPLVAISLVKLVKELEPDAAIQGPLAGVKEARQWLSSNVVPDLILADIQLSDGISFDIFAGDHIDCPIIFTTAYNEYAIRAFKVNSIDYLLKPVDRKDLQNALHKFHQLQSKFSNETYVKQMMNLLGNFSQSKKYKERFAVHQGRSMVLIPQQEVAGFCKEELIYLVNHEGRKFITDYRSLDEIGELLHPADFYRANRQCIIQLAFIESTRTDETGRILVKMKGMRPDEVIISKEKAAEFRKWFEG